MSKEFVCRFQPNVRIFKKVSNQEPPKPASCNCQISKKADCPIPGKCNQNGAVYEAKVSTSDGKIESYVGLAKNFKKRWPKHKKTLKNRNADGQTTLSKYVWRKRDEGLNPQITWHFLEKNVPDFNPVTEICKLCTREKYQIVLNPNVASFNLRTEIFSNCKHKESYLFGEPPD